MNPKWQITFTSRALTWEPGNVQAFKIYSLNSHCENILDPTLTFGTAYWALPAYGKISNREQSLNLTAWESSSLHEPFPQQPVWEPYDPTLRHLVLHIRSCLPMGIFLLIKQLCMLVKKLRTASILLLDLKSLVRKNTDCRAPISFKYKVEYIVTLPLMKSSS